MTNANLQLDKNGKLRHFLTIDGLSQTILTQILDTAESFLDITQQAAKKVPSLRGKTVANLFFEASTRTRVSFELAAKRLSAEVLNLNIATSSTAKGESLLDTIQNLLAMQCDILVMRHQDSGAAHFVAKHLGDNVSVINAGDGLHAHPTQAMLDMLTIRRHKKDFASLRVAIIGDISHSRVARSEIQALKILGVSEIRVIAPKTLLPNDVESLGVEVYHDLKPGLKHVDVIMLLRLQRERMQSALLPSENEFYQCYGITTNRLTLANPEALVMHPGPINRGVEISSAVADGAQSVILEQVKYGIAVRMAIMAICQGL